MQRSLFLLFICLLGCTQEKDFQDAPVQVETQAETVVIKEPERKAEPATPTQDEIQSDTWTFSKSVGSTLIFKEGPKIVTDLFELEYLGQIDKDEKAPFLIYSGRDCDECDANIAIYFNSPRNGKLQVGAGQNAYGYPGKERDYLTDSLLYEARAFYGEVFKGVQGIVWFQKTLMEDGSFQPNIFLAKIVEDSIADKSLKFTNQLLQETLALHKAGKNKEIQGREYKSQP
jgi:hypothetical protein